MEKQAKEKDGRIALTVRRIIAYVVLALLTIISLFSFYILFVNATRANSQIQKGFSVIPGTFLLANLKNLLNNANLPVLAGIRNSFIIATGCAVLSTYVSALTAYAVHAYDFKLKKPAFTFILMIMMVPTQVTALGFVDLMRKFGLMDSMIPLIVPTAAAPIVFFFMKQYLEGSLPMDIVEAARIDGSGEFRTFNQIVLPIMKPAVAVQAIFVFVQNWNNYFVPALILESNEKKTLPILIAQLRSADFLKFDMGQVYMLIAVAVFPVIIVYICLSKYIIQGVALGSVKG